MIYSSNRWQSTRHIVRKHVLIFLQQRNNNTRQRFVKFVSIVQEYKYWLVCIKSTFDITCLSIKTPLFFCLSLIFFTLYFLFTLFFVFTLFFLFTLFFPFTLFLIIFFSTLSLPIFFQVILSFQFHLIFIHLSWSQRYKSYSFIVFYKRMYIL